MNPTFLFCESPLDCNTPDEEYVKECSAVRKMGANVTFYSYETLAQEGNTEKALKRIAQSQSVCPMVYRGWMLKPKQYQNLYRSLQEKGYRLVNDPIQYKRCHYLPENYPLIEDFTPRTRSVAKNAGGFDENDIKSILESFGSSAIVVKDYVKSLKHQWTTACYIPDASDTDHARKVIDEFLDWQANDLNEGLVFREFVPLQDLAIHSRSGMPLHLEFRLFFLDHELIECCNYWDEGDYYRFEKPPLDRFREIAKRIDSRFFTMDVAKTRRNDWIIIELGDGQVSGIPENVDPDRFFQTILRTGL